MKILIKEIRKDLRELKNQWVFKEYKININDTSHYIYTKRFNNWMQIFRINGRDYNFSMGLNQKELLKEIEKTILRATE